MVCKDVKIVFNFSPLHSSCSVTVFSIAEIILADLRLLVFVATSSSVSLDAVCAWQSATCLDRREFDSRIFVSMADVSNADLIDV